ncbi:MAG: hypothetical protein GY866_21395 [Proteobacteria bacterium]|nr:hypothetical protein [Pseudomonadota bacterium]
MAVNSLTSLDFPVRFWGIMIKSLQVYKSSFFNYLLLAILTYIPFLLIDSFSKIDTLDIIEFFHGNFLDIVIFLTLPTLFLEKRVLPIATIVLFMHRFFASAVVISFIQLGTLLFFITFFAQISLGVIIIGIIPYIFLLFAGFFLIMENSPKMISVRYNLSNSIRLVRNQFFSIFWNYINVTIFMILPLFLFSVWYLGRHPELIVFAESLKNSSGNDIISGQKLLNLIQNIVQESGFKWSRIGIHLIFRPLKSLFLCFLFLGIIQEISPKTITRFLGGDIDEEAPVPSAESDSGK